MEYLSTLNFSVGHNNNETFDNGSIGGNVLYGDSQHPYHQQNAGNSNNYRDVNKVLIDSFQRNRNIEDPAYNILIVMYSFLILFGAIGNFLVVLAVVRKPVMRTARNMFIVNLAVSDLVLCLVTMPLTLMEILTKFWPLGEYAVLCKMIGTLQATTIFVSTISITSIALDRYQVIVYPTRDNLQYMGAAIILTGIWLLALILAAPMFLFKRLVQFDINLPSYGINTVAYCVEDWPIAHGRAYYSAFSLFIQYLLPILIVSAAYSRIYGKLRNRIQIGVITSDTLRDRKRQRSQRMRRTNCLLISIAVIFGVSWLPLNLFNLFSDIYWSALPVTQDMLVAYAVCHMIGMSSACSNPLLYGWLNENFRKEFKEILCRGAAGVGGGVTAYQVTSNDAGGGGGGGGAGGSGSGGDAASKRNSSRGGGSGVKKVFESSDGVALNSRRGSGEGGGAGGCRPTETMCSTTEMTVLVVR